MDPMRTILRFCGRLAVLALLVSGSASAGGAQDTGAEAASGPVVVEPGGGDRFRVPAESLGTVGAGLDVELYLDPGTRPEAGAGLAELTLGPGGRLPMHRHERAEVFGYVLSGEGVVETRDPRELVETRVSAGSVWYVPPRSWHALRVTGEAPLRLVVATTPNEETGFLSFLRKAGTPPSEEGARPAPERLAELASEHDLVLFPEATPAAAGARGTEFTCTVECGVDGRRCGFGVSTRSTRSAACGAAEVGAKRSCPKKVRCLITKVVTRPSGPFFCSCERRGQVCQRIDGDFRCNRRGARPDDVCFETYTANDGIPISVSGCATSPDVFPPCRRCPPDD